MAYIGKSPTGTGVRQRYYFTATGGETSLSGADDNGLTLAFSDGNYVDVSLNGIALVAGTDYNTSTANTIGGLSALSASDIVEVVVYDIFTVADTVSAKDGGTFSGSVTASGGLNVGTIKEITGTTTALTIDISGRILTPARPAFRGTITSVGVADYTTETTMTSYTEDFDVGSNFNHSTGIFTVPITGIYQINYFGAFNGAASETSLKFKLIEGSSTLVFSAQTDPQGGSQETIGASLTLSLTASDTLKLNVRADADTSVGITNIDFSGYLVG